MELSKYKENTKNTNITGSAEKSNFVLDIKKSIFLNENDIPETKESINMENNEYNNLLQTKESEEFANRLRASVLGNSTYDQNLTQSDKKDNI